MQEEVESKSINLAVKTTSLTTRVMYNALRSYVQDHKARVNNHRSKKLTKEQMSEVEEACLTSLGMVIPESVEAP